MSQVNRGLTATPAHGGGLGASAVRSRSTDLDRNGSSGFTLIEALVALALVLAFAAALGRLLFQAHRIMVNADGQVAGQVLLRSLLDTPVDRTSLASISHDGETQGLRWRVVAVPMDVDAWLPPLPPKPPSPTPLPGASSSPRPDRVNWAAFRVVASVSLPSGQVITGETVRLGKDSREDRP
jgi:prepilin-type N-terminal cleavage/methylation domain-containing protein